MPSLSPGDAAPSSFKSIQPGAPVAGHQSVATLIFRWKRYIVYASHQQLNILRGPTELVQALNFDKELIAIRAEEDENGRLAVAVKDGIWLLHPETSPSNRVTWSRELFLTTPSSSGQLRTLCWGTEGELLVGSDKVLAGYNTLPPSRSSTPDHDSSKIPEQVEQRASSWTKPIASPVSFAEFNPEGSFIASTGTTDRLVKIWRRLSYEEAIFDYAYLPHDAAVTFLEWRSPDPEKLDLDDTRSVRSYRGLDEQCDALYTLSADAKLRIWRSNSHADMEVMSLYTVVDLVSAIPHSPVLPMKDEITRQPVRYAFVLPSGQYNTAVEAALKRVRQGPIKHSIEHLKEVYSRKPDVVAAFDAQGRMSAWGVSSVGHKRRSELGSEQAATPFHFAHSESIGLRFQTELPASFATWCEGETINIVAHNFGANVAWWRGSVEDFSSSSAIALDRGQQIAVWQGASTQILSLQSTHDLRSVISVTEKGDVQQWSTDIDAMQFHRSVGLGKGITSVDTVQRGKSLLALAREKVILARLADSKGLSSVAHDLDSRDELKWLRLESDVGSADGSYIVYANDCHFTIIDVSPKRSDWISAEPIVKARDMKELILIPLGTDLEGVQLDFRQLHLLIHPRKAGWLRIVGLKKNGSIYRRDVATSALLGSGKAGVEGTVAFQVNASPHISAATSEVVAVVSHETKSLTITDLKQGYVEHEQELSDSITRIRFPAYDIDDSSSQRRDVLAVAYANDTVDVLMRSRYNHHGDELPHQWATVNRLSLAGIGQTISDAAWLADGRLVISAGNGMFVASDQVNASVLSVSNQQQLDLTVGDDTTRILELAERLSAPLTCWQSSILRQLVLHDRFSAVLIILERLEYKLRFFAEGDALEPLLGLDVNAILDRRCSNQGADEASFLLRLQAQLDEINLPFTSNADQRRLKVLVGTMAYVARHRHSLDTYAVRFLFQWQYQVLLSKREQHRDISSKTMANGHGDSHDSETKTPMPIMHSREIVFAYHSTTQQPLLEILVQHYENKFDWATVRALGITLWLRNIKAAQSEGSAMASIEQIFDSIGQNAFRASFPPDPVNASLYLLALRKKAVLLSLWRVAVGNREQKTTQNFLKRNFDEEVNRIAARKNAYALMGKRRFEYAAAFFLLADDVSSALSILAGQCEDIQLAIAVARAFGGDVHNDELTNLMHDRVIPQAQKRGDRWLLHWAYDIAGQHSQAAKALVSDFKVLLEDISVLPTRTWQQDDPATLILYRQLRDHVGIDKKKNQAFKVSAQEEYRAVLRSARVLRRLGFGLLALRLTSRWTFAVPPSEQQRKGYPAEVVETSKTDAGVSSMLDAYEQGGQSHMTDLPSGPAKSTADVSQDLDSSDTAASATADGGDRAAQAAELLAKMRAKKVAQAAIAIDLPEDSSRAEQKKNPTEFNEPAASSILDSFGF